jgi:hypothetical protein
VFVIVTEVFLTNPNEAGSAHLRVRISTLTCAMSHVTHGVEESLDRDVGSMKSTPART